MGEAGEAGRLPLVVLALGRRRTVPGSVPRRLRQRDRPYFLTAAVVAFVVAAAGYDLVTSLSAALTSVGNVGPGLGEIGPFDNFAHFPSAVKLTLCFAMIAGRLELFTILILFHRDFWRR